MERKARHKICGLVSRKEVKHSQVEDVDGGIIPIGLLNKDVKRQTGFVWLKPGARLGGGVFWARHYAFGFHKTGFVWLKPGASLGGGGVLGEALRLWLSQNGKNFLNTGATISFSRTALRGVYQLVGTLEQVTC